MTREPGNPPETVVLCAGEVYRAYKRKALSRNDIDGFPPPFSSLADTPEFSTTRQLTGYAGINAAFRKGNFRNKISFTVSDINRDKFDVPGQAAPSFLARGRTERFGYQGDWQFSDSLHSIFGAEHEKSRMHDGFADFATRATSAFGQLIAKPVKSLTATGGAGLVDHRDYGSQVTLSANAAWQSAVGFGLRTAYGEVFKSPTLFQLNSFFGNTVLQPEETKSYEIGIGYRSARSFEASATFYRRNTRNQIDFVSCFGLSTGICTNRPFGTYDNIKWTSAQGIELDLLLRPTDQLALSANCTLTDTKDKVTGRALLRRPKHSVNLSVD
jgi:vitamin B12 transporter